MSGGRGRKLSCLIVTWHMVTLVVDIATLSISSWGFLVYAPLSCINEGIRQARKDQLTIEQLQMSGILCLPAV